MRRCTPLPHFLNQGLALRNAVSEFISTLVLRPDPAFVYVAHGFRELSAFLISEMYIYISAGYYWSYHSHGEDATVAKELPPQSGPEGYRI